MDLTGTTSPEEAINGIEPPIRSFPEQLARWETSDYIVYVDGEIKRRESRFHQGVITVTLSCRETGNDCAILNRTYEDERVTQEALRAMVTDMAREMKVVA